MRLKHVSSLGLALFTVACGGVGSGTRTPSPLSASADARTAAATEARTRFLAAFDAQDSVLLSSLVAPSFEFVSAERDTVRGAAAVARLLALGAAEPNPLRLYGGRIEPCIGQGLFEHGAGYTGPAGARAKPGVFRQGSFAALWSDANGTVQLARLELSATRRSGPPPASCRLEYVSASTSRRIIASLAIETTPLRPSRGIEAVENVLIAEGFDFTPPENPLRNFPKVRTKAGGLTAGLRLRVRSHWSAELQAGIRAPEEAEGFTTANNRRRVIIKTLPVNLATLVQYQRSFIRLSAGPSLLFQNFTATETHEWPTYYNKGDWNWQKASDERNVARSPSPATGAAAEIAITLPMARRSLTELRIGYAAYGKSTIPATPYFAGGEVSNSMASVALAVGFGW